ncbi:DinB family protein [Ferruginibacter profundus]
MLLNTYLLDTFNYNSDTNKKLLDKIKLLPDAREAIQLFSHLINCQYKWMARIMQDANASQLSWWEPVYAFDQLATEWTKSLNPWLHYITERTEDELSTEVSFIGFDNSAWAATPKDIALQLNYHSIHHRAQIQTLLRQQGIDPDFVDYIGTRYRKLN